jgi:hypothetical protein
MRRFLPSLFLVLAGLALPMAAAAQDLLPASFSGWNASEASVKVRPGGLEQLAGADAAIFREYGTLAAERRAYVRGAETLTAKLYKMRDPTTAYGIYTFLLTDQMVPANLTQYSSVSRQHALVLVGNLLLDVTGGDMRPLVGDLKVLVGELALQADRSPYPTLGQHLPPRGLIAHSERYFLGPVALNRLLSLGNGDWLGFSEGAEAELARYRVNGLDVNLLLASYPTPQVAARKLEELGRWLPLDSGAERSDSHSTLFARRSSSVIAIVTQSPTRAVADSLLQQIHYESQITWNEPRHKLTDPSIAQILVGTIAGTGIILFFALVAGIGFGGVRLVVKHFFPGKVFDRDTQVEILQLGLTSKSIEAKDFY